MRSKRTSLTRNNQRNADLKTAPQGAVFAWERKQVSGFLGGRFLRGTLRSGNENLSPQPVVEISRMPYTYYVSDW